MDTMTTFTVIDNAGIPREGIADVDFNLYTEDDGNVHVIAYPCWPVAGTDKVTIDTSITLFNAVVPGLDAGEHEEGSAWYEWAAKENLPPEALAVVEKYMASQQAVSTEQMRELYAVEGFAAPFVIVRRKADGQVGTLQFCHSPRYYFAFVQDN